MKKQFVAGISSLQKTLLALAMVSLSACGGGGGGSNNSDRNSSSADNQTMQLLQNGIYDMSFFRPSYSEGGGRPIMLTRTHLWIDNVGTYHSDTEYLTTDGWLIKSQVDERMFIGNPEVLALSASGWQLLEAIPCSASPSQNGVAIRCDGLDSLTRLRSSYSLTGDSLAETFADLATRLGSGGSTPVITATSGLTSLLGANASNHVLDSTFLTDELVTQYCSSRGTDQPIANWFCSSGFSSTTWEELALSDESFLAPYVTGTTTSSHRAHLNGDLVNASSGDIVVAEDSHGNLAPGTVIGTWEKRVIHGQTIIRLNRILPSLERYQALAIINDKIVEASYTPAGSIKPTGRYYSPEAATALSDAAIGIFPVTGSN